MTLTNKVKNAVLLGLLPDNSRAKNNAEKNLKTPAKSLIATKSFEEAVRVCKEKVGKISKECRRVNRRYRDPHFDLCDNEEYCLNGLVDNTDMTPAASARVPDIFDNPQFFKDGASAHEIKQGDEGDCWFLAALATVTNMKGLLEKICVSRDEQVGVYGFVFLRDGTWSSVIIDDQLYLRKTLLHDADYFTKWEFEGKEQEYNKLFARGSDALIGAHCADKDETWLPLLEKAYAKIHGDYASISGGFTGEAVEDLTGGVTTDIYTCDILDKNKFWRDDLLKVNQDFLFAASIEMQGESLEREGVYKGHAYSILKAVEAKGKRFVLVRNPWGRKEWTGPWSDGAAEWTSEWLSILGHKFGDDGQFWMSYEDFLKKFDTLDRTRLFDRTWSVTEPRWLDYHVPWAAEYADVRFRFTVAQETPVVIVLSQLDDRYFRGLSGQYTYKLSFRVHREEEEDYIVRSQTTASMSRSTNTEIDLEPGAYTVVFKVEPRFHPPMPSVKSVVEENRTTNREKFKQIAMSADVAYAKAGAESPWRDAALEIALESGKLEKYMGPDNESTAGDTGDGDDEEEDGEGEEDEVEEGTNEKVRKKPGNDDDEWEDESQDGDAPRGKKKDRKKDSESDTSSKKDTPSISDLDEEQKKTLARYAENHEWKAQVVVGLKIYSKDPELTVQVVEPVEEEKPTDLVDPDDAAGAEDDEGGSLEDE